MALAPLLWLALVVSWGYACYSSEWWCLQVFVNARPKLRLALLCRPVKWELTFRRKPVKLHTAMQLLYRGIFRLDWLLWSVVATW